MEQAIPPDPHWLQTLAALEHLESNILKQNADLSILPHDVILSYLRGLESIFPGMHCFFLPVEKEHFGKGLSSSLPENDLLKFHGLPVKPKTGSVTAKWTQPLIIENIQDHPDWADHFLLNWQPVLCSRWIYPINAENQLIGLLLACHTTTPADYIVRSKVMQRTTALLRVMLENQQKAAIIRETNFLLQQSQHLAQFGNWHWDIQRDVVTWSPVLFNIYGLDEETFGATFDGYRERVYPEDREKVYQIIDNVLRYGGETSFEERIIRPNGELRYLRLGPN